MLIHELVWEANFAIEDDNSSRHAKTWIRHIPTQYDPMVQGDVIQENQAESAVIAPAVTGNPRFPLISREHEVFRDNHKSMLMGPNYTILPILKDYPIPRVQNAPTGCPGVGLGEFKL